MSKKKIFKTTALLSVARLGGMAFSALNFWILAHFLGLDKFGIYTTLTAMYGIVYSLASSGFQILIVQRHSEGYGFQHLSRCSKIFLMIAPAWLIISLITCAIMLPGIHVRLLVVVALMFLSDIVMTFFQEMYYAVYQSSNQLNRTIFFFLALQILRCAFNGLAVQMGVFDLLSVAVCQILANGLVLIFYRRQLLKDIDVNKTDGFKELPHWKEDVGHSKFFALSRLSKNIYTDIDKTMLPRMDSISAAGIYSAGDRVVQFALLPMYMLFNVLFPRFFKDGLNGKDQIVGLAKKLLPCSLGYGIVMTVLVYAVAPWIPVILGEDFADSAKAAQILCLIIVLRSFYIVPADMLSGLRKQNIRAYIQMIGVVLNVALNLALIPALGWKGAAYATLASESVLLIMFSVTIGSIILKKDDETGGKS